MTSACAATFQGLVQQFLVIAAGQFTAEHRGACLVVGIVHQVAALCIENVGLGADRILKPSSRVLYLSAVAPHSKCPACWRGVGKRANQGDVALLR